MSYNCHALESSLAAWSTFIAAANTVYSKLEQDLSVRLKELFESLESVSDGGLNPLNLLMPSRYPIRGVPSWTDENRNATLDKLVIRSDLTDEEWSEVKGP